MISSVRQRLASFGFAVQGVRTLVRTQPNMRLHLLASLVVVSAGWWLRVSVPEWLALVLAIGFVWAAEAFNTAVEFLGDAITQERHAWVGKAKDVAAAGVLFAATTAAVVGVLVFGPHLVRA